MVLFVLFLWLFSVYLAAPVPAPPPPMVSPRPQETKPRFVNALSNQPLQFGATAYFECKVQGYPPPEILWTRRGHPLVDKTRYKSTYDQYNGVTTLTILHLQEADEGLRCFPIAFITVIL